MSATSNPATPAVKWDESTRNSISTPPPLPLSTKPPTNISTDRLSASSSEPEISNLDFDKGVWHQYLAAAQADDEKDATRPCPCLTKHLSSFKPEHLCRASVNSVRKRFNANIIPTFPFWNYGDYVLLHPDFAHSHGNPRNRTNGILLVKYIYLGSKTRTHHAVIRFDYRCRFCIIRGNWVEPGIRRTPCFDPFIEARDRRTDFDFPGVVAFVNIRSRLIIMRKYWCWSTLRDEREVVAVYSRKHQHNMIKRSWLWMKLNKLNTAEVRKVTYIEDLIDMGYTERVIQGPQIKKGAEVKVKEKGEVMAVCA